MKEGTIKQNGVANIKSLATLIEQQVVEYDFQFYQQSYPVNCPVIIFSDGRSMFKNTLQVTLKGKAPETTAAPQARAIDEEKLKQVLED